MQRVHIDNHDFNVASEHLNLQVGSLQRHAIFVDGIPNGQLVLESDVGEIVGTNLQECNLATFFKMLEEVFFGDFSSDVPHDDRMIRLEELRVIGTHHKQPLAAIVLLVSQQQQVQIGFVGQPDEGRNRPFGALLLPQEVHLLYRGPLLQVLNQVLLRAGGRNILHVEQKPPVHGLVFCSQRTHTLG